MSIQVDEKLVRHIAKLSRLALTDDEVRLFTSQLGQVLGYVDQLSSVNVDGVEPLSHPLPVTNVLREDEPGPTLETSQALQSAPDRQDGYFRVPAVLDQDSAA